MISMRIVLFLAAALVLAACSNFTCEERLAADLDWSVAAYQDCLFIDPPLPGMEDFSPMTQPRNCDAAFERWATAGEAFERRIEVCAAEAT